MKKINNKGFTLIELLAVIIILAILMVFAVPNVLKIRENATEKAGKTQAQSVFEAIETQAQADLLNGEAKSCYGSEIASNKAGVKDLGSGKYYAKVSGGQVTYFQYNDGSRYYEAGISTENNPVSKSDINPVNTSKAIPTACS